MEERLVHGPDRSAAWRGRRVDVEDRRPWEKCLKARSLCTSTFPVRIALYDKSFVFEEQYLRTDGLLVDTAKMCNSLLYGAISRLRLSTMVLSLVAGSFLVWLALNQHDCSVLESTTASHFWICKQDHACCPECRLWLLIEYLVGSWQECIWKGASQQPSLPIPRSSSTCSRVSFLDVLLAHRRYHARFAGHWGHLA